MALSSTAIVKVIIVTDDLERTAAAYEKLLGSARTMDGDGKEHRQVREPYTVYQGEKITDTPMKVKSVLSENFWFEIIQPLGNHDPWAQWLKDHGTSVCSICLQASGTLEEDEDRMKAAGYASLFKQEKGYEAYEYFDTSRDLGTLLEVKETY